MLRIRLLLLLALSSLMVSAAWADDVGYIDCSSHPDDTKVFGKARQSPDVVGSVPCGERFTVLVYGFVFSRVETRDGKIGFIFSNLISVDHSGTAVLHPASARVPVPRSPSTTTASATINASQTAPSAAHPAPATPVQSEPVAAQSAPAPTAQVAPAPAPVAASPVAASNVPEMTLTTAHPSPATPTPTETAAAQPTTTPVASAAPAPAAPAAQPSANAAEPVAAPAPPSPAAVSRPEPAPSEPIAPAVRDASVRSSWEKPIPGARRTSLVELYGGYALSRFNGGGGNFSNLNGGLGAFGWNLKSWLQITGDSSYNFISSGGTKTVLYGNHFGPRFFLRGRNRWSVTPFVEAMVGGSRLDTTVSGVGGYKTSDNCISYKAGGGVDIHPFRRIELRLIDVDYYRTAFGTNAHQNNYWVSTGIVIRLFGGGGRAD